MCAPVPAKVTGDPLPKTPTTPLGRCRWHPTMSHISIPTEDTDDSLWSLSVAPGAAVQVYFRFFNYRP